jgi:hypothetical protein
MLVVWSSQGDQCLGCIISRWANKMSRKREKKCIQSDQPAWNPGGASATPQSLKYPVFDCAVALCTMQNALLVISNLTWLDQKPPKWRRWLAVRGCLFGVQDNSNKGFPCTTSEIWTSATCRRVPVWIVCLDIETMSSKKSWNPRNHPCKSWR